MNNFSSEEDRQKLFELTDHNRFYWEEEPLELTQGEESLSYAFHSFEDFNRVYDKIFRPKIKARLLEAVPTGTMDLGYFFEWDEPRGSYSLNFFLTSEGDILFSGLLIGPP